MSDGPSPPTPDVSRAGPAAGPSRDDWPGAIGEDRTGDDSTDDPRSEQTAPDPAETTVDDAAGPRRTATLATGLSAGIGLLAALVVGLVAARPAVAATVAGGGAGLAVAVAWLGSTGTVRAVAGPTLGVAALSAVAAGAAAGGLTAATLALAAFGAVATPLDAVGDGRLTDAVGSLLYALVPLGAVALVGVGTRALAPLARAAGGVVDPASVGANLTGFAVLVAAALVAVRTALLVLPVVRLAPRDRRDRIERRVEALDARLRRWTWVAAGAVPVCVVLWPVVDSGPAWLRDGARAVGSVTGTPALRLSLAAVAAGGVVVAASTYAVRRTAGDVLGATHRGTATVVGAVLTAGVVAAHGWLYVLALDAAGAGTVRLLTVAAGVVGTLSTVVVLVLAVVLAVVAGTLALPAAVGTGLTSERAAGPAFGAAGLVGAAVLSVDAVSAPVTLGAVVAGMVVWDLGEFGVGVAEELDGADATAAESTHVVATLGVGVAVLAGAVAAQFVVTRVTLGGQSALAALAVAFVGVVSLAAVLRG